MADNRWFSELRYGLFVHYGLYSLLGRGEWVLNREGIPLDEYRRLADEFKADQFDANALCDLALRSGMKYIVITTMHHDGFRLYDTALSDFNTMRRAARRDLISEVVTAARKRGLRIGLYHSLNNWMDQPDGCAALENTADYERFIAATFARIKELVTRFNPIDILWYDGWWPFNAEQWRAEEMNAMVRKIQPHILFNGRNGLPGDFATPEGHLSAPKPYRPWEACMTTNNNWAFHKGDHAWKSPADIVDMLVTVANGRGNLLLNVGPQGNGAIPLPAVQNLEAVGAWIKRCGECITNTDLFSFDLQEKGDGRAEWFNQGPMSVSGNKLFWLIRRWVGDPLTFAGLQCRVKNVRILGHDGPLSFTQEGGRVRVNGLPETPPDPVYTVVCYECDQPPVIHLTGGLRIPKAPHPHYDPCPSDLLGTP